MKFKEYFRFGSIRALFILAIGSLILAVSLPLFLSGKHLLENIIHDLGTEILQEKLTALLAPVDLRYDKLQRVGLEDSVIHRNEIRETALEELHAILYKQTGTVFVIGQEGDIILSKVFNNRDSLAFRAFLTALGTSKDGTVAYKATTEHHYAVFRYYQPWQSYVGLTILNDELFAPYLLFKKINTIVLIAGLLIAVFFAYIIQRLIIFPIIALTAYATSVSKGAPHTDIPGHYFFELDLLKKDITSMVSSLHQKIEEAAQQIEIIKDREKKLGSALNELQQSEERYREIFDAPSDAIFIHDGKTGKIVDVNLATTRMYGYSHTECLRLDISSFSSNKPPFTQVEADKHIVAAQNYGPQLFQWHARKKDGSLFWVEVSLRFISIRSEPHVIAVVRDIDARKIAEKALATEKERLAVTLRSIGDGVITTDTESRIILINKVAEKLTGWSQKDAAGRPLLDILKIINTKNGTPCANPVEVMLDSGSITELAKHTLLIARDGMHRNISDSCAPIFDAQNRIIGAVLVFRDVTEKLRMEEELLKIKKLESVGVLAAGIAHDFNNILAAILGNLDLTRLKLGPDHAAAPLIEEAEKASLRAKGLTQQLLTFSRGGAPVRKTSSIATVIRDSSAFVLRGSELTCDYDIPENLWLVEIDEGQIGQVIQNIILNARQATPGSGRITITCRNTQEMFNEQGSDHGQFVSIAISDTGKGIPKEVIDKIFDPYFTTKHDGTGLGLAVCHSIVKKHDGRIEVASAPGKGTTFTILLPVSHKDTVEQVTTAPPEESGKKARVLIMDDEKMVREIAGRMLSHLGHDVVGTEDGHQAIEAYQQAINEGRRFDLVLMDLTIPGGMGGKEAVTEIRNIDPDAKVIVSSGYANDPVMSNYQEYGFSGVIAKPFMMDELNRIIAKLL